MNPKGPYLAVATLCERVLHEMDGGLSCIRLMDTIAIELAEDAPDPFPFLYQGHLLITFKSGDYRGPMTLRLEVRDPAGELAKPPLEQLLQFQGDEHGTNSIFQMRLQVPKEGLYYFNLFLGEELVTRIPLRVRVSRKRTEQTNSATL